MTLKELLEEQECTLEECLHMPLDETDELVLKHDKKKKRPVKKELETNEL